MIHPLNTASNTHFFVSVSWVSKARKETFGVTAALIARAGVGGMVRGIFRRPSGLEGIFLCFPRTSSWVKFGDVPSGTSRASPVRR